MLSLKHKHSFSLPHFQLPQQMKLSPVIVDDDELTQAVASDPDTHDNNWELNERPDEVELVAFWEGVEADVKKDPSWFTFDNE